MSETRAAEILGVQRETLSALLNSNAVLSLEISQQMSRFKASLCLLNGNAALSREMALRMEQAFGVSKDLLLRMQSWHNHASQMRASADETAVYRRLYG